MPREGKVSGGLKSENLLFITDLPLRRKIEDAIETMSFLYLSQKSGIFPESLAKEHRRMIILYSASIIEAALLFTYKKSGLSLKKLDYVDVYTLPQTYQADSKMKMVLARQVIKDRDDRELMLDLLLKLFHDKKLISLSLKGKIEKAKNVRNTFHLSKTRKNLQCSTKSTNLSVEAALETIIAMRIVLSAR